MKAIALALCLAVYAQPSHSDAWYRDVCGGPTEDIPDDDPGLKWFPDMPLEDAKVALAIERVNSCDEGGR